VQRLLRPAVLSLALACSTAGLPLAGNAEDEPSGGALSFFADEKDAGILLRRLNADPEIAFIVHDGPLMPSPQVNMPALPDAGEGRARYYLTIAACPMGEVGFWQRWRVVRPVNELKDGEHILWHIAAGPLATYPASLHEMQPIPDPWGGWTSEHPACQPGVMPPATIRLSLLTRHAMYTPQERASQQELVSWWLDGDLLAASDFQWTGASLQPDGAEKTGHWMASLQAWFRQNAVALHPRWGGDEIFWAFPSALARLKSGIPYYSRGFELDDAIREAR
jgi:hypothetical protein